MRSNWGYSQGSLDIPGRDNFPTEMILPHVFHPRLTTVLKVSYQGLKDFESQTCLPHTGGTRQAETLPVVLLDWETQLIHYTFEYERI